MKFNDLERKIGKLLIFNKNVLRNFERQAEALNANIKYWLKNKKIIQLKKGLYVLMARYQQESQKDLYLEYIANQLLAPSYVSLEYVLAKYQLLSEPVNAITSITSKTTREVVNNLGAFRFYSITSSLFTGYEVKYFYNSPILIASKAKALFDFLYLRFLKQKPISEQALLNLRINWENLNQKELKELIRWLLSVKNKKINQLAKIIKKIYAENSARSN